MYLQTFGLQRNPFGMTPDPSFLYLAPQQREVLAGLAYAVLDQKGFVVLIGDAGTGKTTLLTRVLEYLPADRIRTSVIFNPTLNPAEFLEMAMLDFGIADIPASKAQRLAKLEEYLLAGRKAGKITALVIDEAHKLSPEVLEEIRLLGNYEDSSAKLLQILLIGQNEFHEVLNRDDLRQLKQRVAMRLKIDPLSAAEVGTYIQHRWSKAGGSATPFTADAVAAIVTHSRCIPRVINVLCDNSLMLAFSRGEANVSAGLVHEAARDLQLVEPVKAQAPAVEAPAVEAPADKSELAAVRTVEEPRVALAAPLRSLERYGSASEGRSLWARWAVKLGLA